MIFLGCFWADLGHFCGRAAILWCRNPFLGPTNFALGHLLKTEWLVADVTPVRPPARAKRDIFRDDFGSFLAKSGRFCVLAKSGNFCDWEETFPSWALIFLLRFKNRVFGCQRNTCPVAWRSRPWHFGDAFGRFLANSGLFLWPGNHFVIKKSPPGFW